jgi:hypothetical protein
MPKISYKNIKSDNFLMANWKTLVVILAFVLLFPLIKGIFNRMKFFTDGQSSEERKTQQEFKDAYNSISNQFSPSQAQYPSIHKQRATQIYDKLQSPYSGGSANLYVRDRFKKPGYENIDFQNWNHPTNIVKLQQLGITNQNYQTEWHRVYLDKHDILGIYKEFGLRQYSYLNGGAPTWIDSITDLLDFTDTQNIDLWGWITEKFSPALKEELKTAFNKKGIYL